MERNRIVRSSVERKKRGTVNSREIIQNLMTRYPVLLPLEGAIEASIVCMKESFQKGHTLLVCGNGGSAADSLHFTGELMKEFAIKRKFPSALVEALKQQEPEEYEYYLNHLHDGLPTISLVNEVGLMTAFANDNSGDLVFAQQVLCHGKKGGTLLCFSTSGNSKNVLHGAKIAKLLEMSVVSLTGDTGGHLKDVSDILINVPESETYKIQELHLPIYHGIAQALESEFFG